MLAERLTAFSLSFAKYFKSSTKSNLSVANQFLQGLILAPLSNCQAMANVVKETTNNQSLNHFLSDSAWDWQKVMDAIAKRCFKQFLALKEPIALIIDESGIPKKGKSSVGVAHQYCGQSGKQDNCQVEVFGALSCRNLVSIIQSKLYLPKEWTSDKERCIKAGVPSNEIVYKSKIDLAKEIIFHVWKKLDIKFTFVSFDAFYGRDLSLLQTLHKEGIVFLADIPDSHCIFLKDFNIEIPEKKPGKGRTPKHVKPTEKRVKVCELAKGLKKKDYKKITIRKATNGNIKALFYKRTVWVYNAKNKSKSKFVLLIRKDNDGTIRFSLTNSNATLQKLAFMQGQRYFIERSFQDAKQQLGMNQYQVRSFSGWHRHITMSMLGLQFLTEEKLRQSSIGQFLTSKDIIDLLEVLLPQKKITLNDLIRMIKKKNKHLKTLALVRKPG